MALADHAGHKSHPQVRDAILVHHLGNVHGGDPQLVGDLFMGDPCFLQCSTIVIKRLENIVGGRVRIISDNRAEAPPYEAEARDIRIIGQVIWFAGELVPKE